MGLTRGVPEPAQALAEASIDDTDPALRRRAVQALGQTDEAVETLVGVLRRETDNSVRHAAFSALAGIGSLAAARGAASLLSEPDPAQRNGALEALSAMPEPSAALLEDLGQKGDPDVRSFAVLLAAGLPQPAARDWLIALADRETDPNVCAHLAEALGGSHAPGASGALEAIRARFPGNAYLGFAVDLALGRLRDI